MIIIKTKKYSYGERDRASTNIGSSRRIAWPCGLSSNRLAIYCNRYENTRVKNQFKCKGTDLSLLKILCEDIWLFHRNAVGSCAPTRPAQQPSRSSFSTLLSFVLVCFFLVLCLRGCFLLSPLRKNKDLPRPTLPRGVPFSPNER